MKSTKADLFSTEKEIMVNHTTQIGSTAEQTYDRKSGLKAFDDTKAGVKGLVDAGITHIPQIFIPPPHLFDSIPTSSKYQYNIPIIDLQNIFNPNHHKKIVEKVKEASETWGFFQIVNHGIPVHVLDEMINGVIRFHEQDSEIKKELYTRDFTKSVVYNSFNILFSSVHVNWRDSLFFSMYPNSPDPQDMPVVCRDIVTEYSKQVMNLGGSLLELLSEALGLEPTHLKDIGCAEGLRTLCHYYPACPQPELTLGTSKHSDIGFITVLLQDHIGGLQILHQNHWIDVPPTPGALIVNIGDFLQVLSNDKFISVEHRVLANHVGPRISVACNFRMGVTESTKLYEPIKNFLAEDNPPKYRAFTINEYIEYFRAKGLDGVSTLLNFRV